MSSALRYSVFAGTVYKRIIIVFSVTWVTYLIVCPLVFLGGFVDSIAGGGGLITLPAYMVAGLPAHNALATNKFSAFLGTTIAGWNYIKAGFVDLNIAIVGVIFAIVGSAIGTNLALLIEASVLKIVILVLLPITAVFVLSNKGLSKKRIPYSVKKTSVLSSIIAFVIGAYDGFYGPGTGTFIIILLNIVAHLDINKANGNSKIINLASGFSAMVIFLINGKTFILLGLAGAVSQFIGSYIGSKLFIKKGLKIIRPIMIFVLILLLIKVLYDMFV